MATQDDLMMQQLLKGMSTMPAAGATTNASGGMLAPTQSMGITPISDPSVGQYNQVVTGNLGMLRIGGTAGQEDGNNAGTADINFQSKPFKATDREGNPILPGGADGSIKFNGTLATNNMGQTATGGAQAHLGYQNLSVDPYGSITKPIEGQATSTESTGIINPESKPAANNLFSGGGLTPESTTYGVNLGYAVPGAFPGMSPLKVGLNAERKEVGALPTTPLSGNETTDSTAALFAGMSGATSGTGSTTTDTYKATLAHQAEIVGGSLNSDVALHMSEETGTASKTNTQGYNLGTNYQGRIFDGGIRLDSTNGVTTGEFGTTTDQSQNIGGNLGLNYNGLGVRLDGTQGETTQLSEMGASTTDTKQGTAELSYDLNGTKLYTGTSADISRSEQEGYSSSQTKTNTVFAGVDSSQTNGLHYNGRVEFGQTTSSQTATGIPEFGIPEETTTTETTNFTAKSGVGYAPKTGLGGSLDMTYGYETPQSLFGDSISTGGHSIATKTSVGYTGQQGRSIWNVTGGTETNFGSNGPGAVGLFANGSWQTGRVNIAADGQYQVYGKENPLKPNGYRIGATGSMSI